MADPAPPRTPAGLSTAGRRFWRQVVRESNLVFRPDELVLLVEAAHIADTIAGLRGGFDPSKPDPRIAREIRLQQEGLRKLLRSLDIPDEGAESWDGLTAAQRGRRAALARWRRGRG